VPTEKNNRLQKCCENGKGKGRLSRFFLPVQGEREITHENKRNAGLIVPVDVTGYFKKLAFLCMDN